LIRRRQEQERGDRGAQPVERRADRLQRTRLRAIDTSGNGEDAAPHQGGDGEEYAGPGNTPTIAEERRGIFEQAEAGEEPAEAAVGGIGVERGRAATRW